MIRKFPWKSGSTTHLSFLPSNPTILKAFPKSFPAENTNILNTKQKKKTEARKAKD